MKITYYIDDGYAGSKTAPQYFNIPDDEIKECETKEQLESLLEEEMQASFQEKVTPYLSDRSIAEAEAIRIGQSDEDVE